MVRILAIGNSFSQDATAYLYEIAKRSGKTIKVVNLYIGSCSLSLHWENALADKVSYLYEEDGVNTGKIVSLRTVLAQDDWDIVTLQQASGSSGIYESYNPYLKLLSEYVNSFVPNADIYLHQTWAYDVASRHPSFESYNYDQGKMHDALVGAYQKAADSIGVGIIPCGQVIQALRKKNIYGVMTKVPGLCRDGHHLEPTYGRYAAAATWFECLLGGDILADTFLPLFPIDDTAIAVLRSTVHEICSKNVNSRKRVGA